MNRVFFERIIIADIAQKVAICQEFAPGLNVFTSSDNGMGKSCLLKSLYHSMGADVNFSDAWDAKGKIYITTISVNGKKYKVSRFDKAYIVSIEGGEEKYFNSISEGLREEFAEIFGLQIYVKDKSNKYKLGYPICYFLPYYIDQDYGWCLEPYQSFARHFQYHKRQKDEIIDYHLSLTSIDDVRAREKKDELKTLLTNAKSQLNELTKRNEALCKDLEGINVVLSDEEARLQMEEEKRLLTEKIEEIAQVREQIKALQEEYYHCSYYLDFIRRGKGHIVSGEEPVGGNYCPQCGCLLEDRILEDLRGACFAENKGFIVKQLQLNIDNIELQLDKSKRDYEELSTQLHAFHKSMQYMDYFKAVALKELLEKVISERGRLSSEIEKLKKEKNAIKLHDFKEERARLDKKYISKLKEYMKRLGAWTDENENKRIGEKLSGQGSQTPKGAFCQNLALIQIIAEDTDAKVQFPFVLDSPRGSEVSDISGEEIMTLLYASTGLSQIVLATLDFKRFVSPDVLKHVKLVELTRKNQLLDEESYLSYQFEIQQVAGAFEAMRVLKQDEKIK